MLVSLRKGEKPMKRVSKSAISISVFACTAVLSFGWSEQGGVSFSVESAQARVGRPLTPVSVAGVARRHNRRAAYGYGVAGAAAVGTAGAVAAANAPYYSGSGNNTGGGWSNSYAQTDPHYGQPFYAHRAYYGQSPYYAHTGWDDYAVRGSIKCAPGSTIKLDDGNTYICQ
jgi:hypothetical protein